MESLEKCPWCGSLISREKFNEIQARIRAEEKTKYQKLEIEMRKGLEQKFRLDLEREKKKAAQVEKKKVERNTKALNQLKADYARTVKKNEDLEARKVSFEKEASEKAAKGLKKQLDEQRTIMQRDYDQSILKVRADIRREREAAQKKVAALERQLQKKTANELGEGAEIDLLETLRDTFPDDRITRVKKGEIGADIHHEVVFKGELCGKIVLDSKNRQGWHRTFATKLREDQLAAKADHAILSTTVFPSGKRELCIEEGVIVISPARAVNIVELLRATMIRMHQLGLSMKDRAGKMNRLYKFITSEKYAQSFNQAGKLTNDILEVDVQEEREHQKVWKTRGRLATQLKNVLRGIDSEVCAILEGSGEAEVEVDTGDACNVPEMIPLLAPANQ